MAAAPAWQTLPLRSFKWESDDVPAVLLQQLGVLQGLTQLVLQPLFFGACRMDATPGQLAVALQQLTSLRWLCISRYDSMAADGEPSTAASGVDGVWHDSDDVKAFLQAVGGLSMLEEAGVMLPVRLQDAAVRELRGCLQQLLPGRLARCCEVHDDSVVIALHTVNRRQRQQWVY